MNCQASMPFLKALQDVSAGNIKIAQRDYQETGLIPIVDQGKSLIAAFTDNAASAIKTDGPHIVFGDHTRAIKYIDFPFAMGADGVKVLRAGAGFNPKYLYYYLRSRNIPNLGYSRHFKLLKELKVPRPALDEQQRIASILDHADSMCTKRREQLAHLDTLPQSIFCEMFTHLRDSAPLDELGQVITGKTPPTASAEYFQGAIPFITPGDLGRNKPAQRYLSDEGARFSRLVSPGSTFVCCIGATIGKIDTATTTCAFNQQINAVQWGPRITPEFGREALISRRGVIIEAGSSTTLPLLPKSRFAKIAIPVASEAEQAIFSQHISAVRRMRSKILIEVEALDRLFASLQSRAFRGEL